MSFGDGDFYSYNGQIEFRLTECVRRRKKGKEPGGGRSSIDTVKRDMIKYDIIYTV